MEITNKDRVIRAFAREYEMAMKYLFPICSKTFHRTIEQSIVILDVHGGSAQLFTKESREIIQLASQMSQDNFPEMMAK